MHNRLQTVLLTTRARRSVPSGLGGVIQLLIVSVREDGVEEASAVFRNVTLTARPGMSIGDIQRQFNVSTTGSSQPRTNRKRFSRRNLIPE